MEGQQHQHDRNQHDHHQHGDQDESGLAEILDVDAVVFAPHIDELLDWVEQHSPAKVNGIVDVGAGTGAGTLALARRYTTATLTALDNSTFMLERLRTVARENGLGDRVRTMLADLDTGWPEVGDVDIVWAASSLHHMAGPDRVLRDIHAALNAGGLLVVVEMDAFPRFLPDDIGLGRPGFETRLQDVIDREGGNAHPGWQPHIENVGFEKVMQRTFTFEPMPAPPGTGRYARANFSRRRSAIADELDSSDLETLDRLLSDDHPDSLLHRADLAVRGSRTVWLASREGR